MVASFGEKREMTQVFREDGRVVPVTEVKILPDTRVSALLTGERDGYNALQLAARYSDSQDKPAIKGEVRLQNAPSEEVSVGEEMNVSRFEPDMKLTVTGTSKSKGFAGVMKRHGFSGKDATHGTKHDERRPGSIGGMFPQNVRPGRKMPGQAGKKTVTLRNRQVVSVNEEENTILIKGSLPGPEHAILKISQV
ncbi:MAG: 50S ribosomal protein L3 [Parcubacteria group bacterium SW_4_49_11]|nr:MAG: 50S ribosomal protein L3 [Parcubacteria group bacterium SW_4_49_11]